MRAAHPSTPPIATKSCSSRPWAATPPPGITSSPGTTSSSKSSRRCGCRGACCCSGWCRASEPRLRERDARVWLPLAWVLLVLVFFSLSPGKRGVYIMPALPALALASLPFLAGTARADAACASRQAWVLALVFWSSPASLLACRARSSRSRGHRCGRSAAGSMLLVFAVLSRRRSADRAAWRAPLAAWPVAVARAVRSAFSYCAGAAHESASARAARFTRAMLAQVDSRTRSSRWSRTRSSSCCISIGRRSTSDIGAGSKDRRSRTTRPPGSMPAPYRVLLVPADQPRSPAFRTIEA